MKQRILALVMCLMLCVGLLPMTASATDPVLYIEETEVTGTSGSGTGWSYSEGDVAATLTLSDFTYSGEGSPADYGISVYNPAAIIYAGTKPLTISLSGTSSVTCTAASSVGIYSIADVFIEGEGTLSATGTNDGICCYQTDFTVQDAETVVHT